MAGLNLTVCLLPPSVFVPLAAVPTLIPRANQYLTDDWSTWVSRGYTPGFVWPSHDFVAANATYRYLATDVSVTFYWSVVMLSFFFYTIFIWYLSLHPQELPDAPACCSRCPKRCGRCFRVKETSTGLKLPWTTVELMLGSASKVMDVCKIVSVLYIFLSAQNLTTMVCDTPAVLLGGGDILRSQAGWMVSTSVPNYLSNAKVNPDHYFRLGYSIEQYHAVIALFSATVDYRYFYTLYGAELVGLAIVVCTWSAVEKHHWAWLYGAVSVILAVAWGVYGTQSEMEITLLDGASSACGPNVIYCVVPGLPLISRSFSALHMLIAGFFTGLAGAKFFGCCTRCGGKVQHFKFIKTVPTAASKMGSSKQDENASDSTSGAAGSLPDFGAASNVNAGFIVSPHRTPDFQSSEPLLHASSLTALTGLQGTFAWVIDGGFPRLHSLPTFWQLRDCGFADWLNEGAANEGSIPPRSFLPLSNITRIAPVPHARALLLTLDEGHDILLCGSAGIIEGWVQTLAGLCPELMCEIGNQSRL